MQSNIKSVLEAFNWGLSEAQTAENIITRAVNIFIPAPYQVIRHASNFGSSDNVQWTQDSYDPIRDSTRLMQKRISRGIGRGWYYKAFYVDSVTIKKRD